ncbi:hypothetical protein SAMN05421812_106119 [Asanoa hainanensis]|uniref:Uncharacterized protein n=1 Tax=Asanoa hainanensis TaxID=560556 RepID=A0A239MRB3_9ACTN|nr:hypothetical protein SAMN05421812_106119 [Asanoa hainanensis]
MAGASPSAVLEARPREHRFGHFNRGAIPDNCCHERVK